MAIWPRNDNCKLSQQNYYYFSLILKWEGILAQSVKFVLFQQKVDMKRKPAFKAMIWWHDKLPEKYIISFWHLVRIAMHQLSVDQTSLTPLKPVPWSLITLHLRCDCNLMYWHEQWGSSSYSVTTTSNDTWQILILHIITKSLWSIRKEFALVVLVELLRCNLSFLTGDVHTQGSHHLGDKREWLFLTRYLSSGF